MNYRIWSIPLLHYTYFINIDLNWPQSSFSILYQKKDEDFAKEKTANLGSYLYQQYKDPILQSLTISTQERISEVTWNTVSDRLSTKLDREFDDIIEVRDALEYIDIFFITSTVEHPPPISLQILLYHN